MIAPRQGTKVTTGLKAISNQGSSPIWNQNWGKSNYSGIPNCILNVWEGAATQKTSLPDQQPPSHRSLFLWGIWAVAVHTVCRTEEFKLEKSTSKMQTAQRKKSLVSLVLSTRLKLQMEKSQWGSLLWFSLEIESFSFFFLFFLLFFFSFFCFVALHTHIQGVHSWKQLVIRVLSFWFMIF